MQETLLTAQEVAKLLNLRVPTVYAAAASGRIPSVRLWRGQRRHLIRFRRVDIDRFIEERSVPVNAAESERS